MALGVELEIGLDWIGSDRDGGKEKSYASDARHPIAIIDSHIDSHNRQPYRHPTPDWKLNPGGIVGGRRVGGRGALEL